MAYDEYGRPVPDETGWAKARFVLYVLIVIAGFVVLGYSALGGAR